MDARVLHVFVPLPQPTPSSYANPCDTEETRYKLTQFNLELPSAWLVLK